MAEYHDEDIIKKVRLVIDQNRVDDGLRGATDIDTLELDDIIRYRMTEAINTIHLQAPPMLLEPIDVSTEFEEKRLYFSDGHSLIDIPADMNFLRLVEFQMDPWARSVFEVILPGDPRFDMQSSSFAGIRGTPEKPAVTLEHNRQGEGGYWLGVYSTPEKEDAVWKALIMKRAVLSASLNISRQCYDAFVYKLAALTLTTLQDPLAAEMERLSALQLNL